MASFVVTGEEATQLVGLSTYELRKYQLARERGVVHAYALIEARRERALAGRPGHKRGAKVQAKFSLLAALNYAGEHAKGYNEDAVGHERSQRGNVEGAARLCAWAIARHVRGPGGRDRVQKRDQEGQAIARAIAKQWGPFLAESAARTRSAIQELTLAEPDSAIEVHDFSDMGGPVSHVAEYVRGPIDVLKPIVLPSRKK
jgi:hypothetical protein